VDTDAERVQHEVEHIRGKDNVVADTLSRFPPDVDAAVTRNVDLPIVGATLTEKQFITALFVFRSG
jgi:putative N-acetylmannosamine-6-phosphate epimerase